jgi:hypothetical protein
MGEALCPSFQNSAVGKALGPADKFVVKGQKRGVKFEIGKNTKM